MGSRDFYLSMFFCEECAVDSRRTDQNQKYRHCYLKVTQLDDVTDEEVLSVEVMCHAFASLAQ